MTSGRSLTRICLGYRHWVLCDNVFGGRVLNPRNNLWLCGGVQVAQDAMQSLKASLSRKHGAILEIIPA